MSTDQANNKPPDTNARNPRNWKFTRKDLDRELPGTIGSHLATAESIRREALRGKRKTADKPADNNQAK